MNKFEELGLCDPILKSIQEKEFKEPSEIQAKTIPLILEGKDVIAGAATGSGKTLAFGAGLIQHSKKGAGIQALVLTPTRELAEQVSKVIKMFSKHKPLNILSVYGGVGINPQISALKNTDIVVGTPGRILDHLERGTLDLSCVRTFVLDEADRMLDMGFFEDVERIMSQCPKERQMLFYSATLPPDVKRLAEEFMNSPVSVSVSSYVDPRKLKQVFYDTPDKMKFSLLVHLLKKDHVGVIMIFCNSRRNCDFVANNLTESGIKAMALHGGFSQDKRNKVMEQFHSKEVHVLVCTDVAARGLDIEGVSHVYNYDIPKESKQYVHRVGRTARAGENGMAINILTSHDHENYARVLRDFDMKIEKLPVPDIQRVRITWMEPRQGFGGQRRDGNRASFGGNRGQSRGGSSGGFGSNRGSNRGSSGGSSSGQSHERPYYGL